MTHDSRWPNRVLIINNGSRYIDNIGRLCPNAKIHIVKPKNIILTEADTSDLILLSGGDKHLLNNSDGFYTKEVELIKRRGAPIIGICLGFQLIAHIYGATINKMESRRKGLYDIGITENGEKLIQQINLRVYENHQHAVSNVPNDFLALAISETGVEAMRHKTLPMFGLQFHPEIDDGHKDGSAIFQEILAHLRS